ncbi:hypothetical protein Ancab_010929 [Ancistrocladus abbreviatus]
MGFLSTDAVVVIVMVMEKSAEEGGERNGGDRRVNAACPEPALYITAARQTINYYLHRQYPSSSLPLLRAHPSPSASPDPDLAS